MVTKGPLRLGFVLDGPVTNLDILISVIGYVVQVTFGGICRHLHVFDCRINIFLLWFQLPYSSCKLWHCVVDSLGPVEGIPQLVLEFNWM